MDIFSYHSDPEFLDGYNKKQFLVPELAFEYANRIINVYEKYDDRIKICEYAIAKSHKYSYEYARDVIKKPFKMGEDAIAKSATHSHFYAMHVLKERFMMGEPTIAAHIPVKQWYNQQWGTRL